MGKGSTIKEQEITVPKSEETLIAAVDSHIGIAMFHCSLEHEEKRAMQHLHFENIVKDLEVGKHSFKFGVTFQI